MDVKRHDRRHGRLPGAARQLHRRSRATRSTATRWPARHLWNVLWAAGQDLGLKPFGMRAMMSLRLDRFFGSLGARVHARLHARRDRARPLHPLEEGRPTSSAASRGRGRARRAARRAGSCTSSSRRRTPTWWPRSRSGWTARSRASAPRAAIRTTPGSRSRIGFLPAERTSRTASRSRSRSWASGARPASPPRRCGTTDPRLRCRCPSTADPDPRGRPRACAARQADRAVGGEPLLRRMAAAALATGQPVHAGAAGASTIRGRAGRGAVVIDRSTTRPRACAASIRKGCPPRPRRRGFMVLLADLPEIAAESRPCRAGRRPPTRCCAAPPPTARRVTR